jgi:hypothetical protein
MTSEDLTKKIDDLLQGRTLEEVLREVCLTQEERDYIDKLWAKPIYEKFGEKEENL